MANFLTSSIGKKFIQSVTGAFLVIFLLLHGTINFFSVIDSLHGNFGKVAEDTVRFSEGDGWFQLGCDFMSTPVIDIMVPILALGFILHIGFGIWLSIENYRKRGGIKRYEVASKAEAENPYYLLMMTFKNWWMVALYIVWFIALFLHLEHGFWSMFQTIGWNNKKWQKRLKVIGIIIAALIVLLFVATAINAHIEAGRLL